MSDIERSWLCVNIHILLLHIKRQVMAIKKKAHVNKSGFSSRVFDSFVSRYPSSADFSPAFHTFPLFFRLFSRFISRVLSRCDGKRHFWSLFSFLFVFARLLDAKLDNSNWPNSRFVQRNGNVTLCMRMLMWSYFTIYFMHNQIRFSFGRARISLSYDKRNSSRRYYASAYFKYSIRQKVMCYRRSYRYTLS